MLEEDQLPSAAVLITENTVNTETSGVLKPLQALRKASFLVLNYAAKNKKDLDPRGNRRLANNRGFSVVTVFSVIRTAALGN
jgi:hypothetical protein